MRAQQQAALLREVKSDDGSTLLKCLLDNGAGVNFTDEVSVHTVGTVFGKVEG